MTCQQIGCLYPRQLVHLRRARHIHASDRRQRTGHRCGGGLRMVAHTEDAAARQVPQALRGAPTTRAQRSGLLGAPRKRGAHRAAAAWRCVQPCRTAPRALVVDEVRLVHDAAQALRHLCRFGWTWSQRGGSCLPEQSLANWSSSSRDSKDLRPTACSAGARSRRIRVAARGFVYAPAPSSTGPRRAPPVRSTCAPVGPRCTAAAAAHVAPAVPDRTPPLPPRRRRCSLRNAGRVA